MPMKNSGLLFLVAFLRQFWTRCLSPASGTKTSLLVPWSLQPTQDLVLQMWLHRQDAGQQRLQESLGTPPVGTSMGFGRGCLCPGECKNRGKGETAHLWHASESSFCKLSWSSLRKPTWPDPGVRVTAIIPMSNFRWLTSNLQYCPKLQHWVTVKVRLD